jgi:CubicO group peptidase (beta-lactamase class C family)
MIGSSGDWVQLAKMLSPVGGRGTLHGRRILSPRAVELMFKNHLVALNLGGEYLTPETVEGIPWGGVGVGWGLGGFVMADPVRAGSVLSRGTFGWMGLMNTQFVYDPVEDMAMIMMSQKAMAPHDFKYDLASGNSRFHRLVYSALKSTRGNKGGSGAGHEQVGRDEL